MNVIVKMASDLVIGDKFRAASGTVETVVAVSRKRGMTTVETKSELMGDQISTSRFYDRREFSMVPPTKCEKLPAELRS